MQWRKRAFAGSATCFVRFSSSRISLNHQLGGFLNTLSLYLHTSLLSIFMRMPTLKNWPVLLGCCGALLIPAANRLHAGDSADPGRLASRNGQPLNLARASFGAQLEVPSANAAAASAALLHDDDPLGYPLPEGSVSMVLTLPKIEVLNRFNFLNLTASGQVAVSVSSVRQGASGGDWRQVQAPKPFSGSEVITCDLGSVEARYVRIDFQVEKPGNIDTFGLFGLTTLGHQDAGRLATVSGASDKRLLLYNYAVSSSDAGVVMVSPGEDVDRAQSLADGDIGSSFAFKATDPMPMAVIDLGTTRTLHRVSTSFKAGPGHIDIYLVEDPRQPAAFGENARKPVKSTIQEVVASDFPAGRDPVLSADTGKQPGLNRVSANANGHSGRYLVMMFHPAGGGSAPEVSGRVAAADFKDFKDFKDAGDFKDAAPQGTPAPQVAAASSPLEISEITAFGDIPPGSRVQTPPNLPGVPVTPGGSNIPTAPNAPPVFPPSAGGNAITP
jgi:hypothetical protein